MKLRNREIKKIGITDNKLSSEIIHLAQKNYFSHNKQEVLKELEDLIRNPEASKKHKIFGNLISQYFSMPLEKKQEKKLYHLVPEKRDYIIFGSSQIEAEAIKQMDMAMQLPITAKGALMADAHSGYGLPIGGVLATLNAIIPYGVGMDIGCRMCLSVYPLPPVFIDNNRAKIKKILIENTRFGKEEFARKTEHEVIERNEFRDITILKELKDKAWHQLGTSGSGNHFVDVGIFEIADHSATINLPSGQYLAILSHSGSRHMGAGIAKYYTQVAKEKCGLSKGAQNLAWLDLDSEEGIEYWMAMNLAGDYAAANHHIIHNNLSAALGEKPIFTAENHHNFAWKEKSDNGTEVIIHRKGATPAHAGILGVIPGSMVSPAFLVRGKGNVLSLNSAAHGAGRKMSRARAKVSFTQKSLTQTLKKAGVELLGGGLDEAPGAYKDIHKIMNYQKDLVEILAVFYPKIVRMCGN
ncbi:MAG: RtcB family protein [Bacteroidales bacterium]|nr:RtcB family protein [Bacteroidales bacterium]